MSDFKNGGVPTPDYDSGDVNYINDKTEFTEDVFIYGDTYAQSYNGVEISVYTYAIIRKKIILIWKILYTKLL